MTELLTAAQMRAIEQAAIASGAVTGRELMERAGRGAVEAILAEWPDLAATSHRAVILCGPGNNGGDGFVMARVLKEWGWDVDLFLLGDPTRLPPDARANHDRWAAGSPVRPFADAPAKVAAKAPDLIVDALFGTGVTRPLSGEVAGALSDIRDRACKAAPPARIVAVDLPSGVDADTGNGPGALPAQLTATFHRAKLGHYLGPGPGLCGALRVVDIGLSGAPALPLVEVAGPEVAKRAAHKYEAGHVLVLSGPAGRTGAARLAARGALRIGAGLVTLGCPPGALAECAAQSTAVLLAEVPDGPALGAQLDDSRLNALCLGPGLGLDRADLVAAALAAQRPTVLDADALTVLSRNSDLFAQLHSACVLTPHGGEFARLFPDLSERMRAPMGAANALSAVDAVREAAARAGCVVLLKGAATVIARPDGRAAINAALYDRAAPWLATAGAGDVLSGFIAGLLARGLSPAAAAEYAAWLHVEAARSFGPGLIAEDLPEELPRVFRALGL